MCTGGAGGPPNTTRERCSTSYGASLNPTRPDGAHAARRVAAGYGGAAGIDNRARHLLKLVETEVCRPGPATVEALLVAGRITRAGKRAGQRWRASLRLRYAKERAARRRWGGVYSRWREVEPLSAPHLHSDDESVEDFLQAWIGA